MTRLLKTMGAVLAGCLCFSVANATPIFTLPIPANNDGDVVRVQDAPDGQRRGYKGVRDQRPGYRRGNDGWWYPLAAFAAGAIIGGAVDDDNDRGMPPPPPPQDRRAPLAHPARDYGQSLSPEHYAWCARHYRTYRATDNTYVPAAGARAQCRSPY